MTSTLSWLKRRAENVAVAMLAAMFLTFIIQIFARYVLAEPFSWTLELCLTLWLWLVFWGNAFVLDHDDHITFDLFYLAAPTKVRRILSLIIAASIAVGLGYSLYPTWDYIDFLKIKKSATLHIPLRTIFSVYAIFLIAVTIKYAIRFIQILRNGMSDDHISETIDE